MSRADRLLLIDKSAFTRRGAEQVPGEPCLCTVTRLEILYSARSPDDYLALDAHLDSYRELRVNAETFAIARTAQRDLARGGRHRVPMPDLLIGACAQQHAADVLHVDRHYELLAGVLSFTPLRLDDERDEVTDSAD
ncbi:hypothetical protein BH20ACT18_BH20ACT18_10130 [soil metagenome]